MQKYFLILAATSLLTQSLQADKYEYFSIKNKRSEAIQLVGSGSHQCVDDPPAHNPQITVAPNKTAFCRLKHSDDFLCEPQNIQYRLDIYRDGHNKGDYFTIHAGHFDVVPSWLDVTWGCRDCPIDWPTYKFEDDTFCILLD